MGWQCTLTALNVLTTRLLEMHSEESVNCFSPLKLLLDHVVQWNLLWLKSYRLFCLIPNHVHTQIPNSLLSSRGVYAQFSFSHLTWAKCPALTAREFISPLFILASLSPSVNEKSSRVWVEFCGTIPAEGLNMQNKGFFLRKKKKRKRSL